MRLSTRTNYCYTPAHPMPYKIMLADDDPDISRVIDAWLKKEDYSVVHCYSGQEFLAKLETSKPDLILMDVLLGDADGSNLCKQLHENPTTRHIPVILMSANRTRDEDMISGLKGGADDYLLKPLKPAILLAKIETVLRRMRAPAELGEILRRHGLTLDVSKRTVRKGKKEIHLPRKEFDLLTVLLRRSGKVVSSKYLLETVWGHELEDYNDPHTVQVHLSRLKKRLGGFAVRIKTVVGSGYTIE